MKISVVLVVKNEEKRIKTCLESVKWADEIIVIDDGSTDKTRDVALRYTKKVYQHSSKGYVEAARNFGLEKATGDWILLLDADELIPAPLAALLKNTAEENKVDYVKVPRRNIIFGQWIQHNTGWWPDYQLRFFKKGSVTWPEKIHAQPDVSGEGLILPPDEKNAIQHENYTSISQFLEKLDRYTTIEADEKGGEKTWENAWLAPSDEFMSRFFARDGYKDGLHGLVLSLLESFYAEVLFAKRWEKAGFYSIHEEDFLQKNYHLAKKIALQYEYWYLTSLLHKTSNPLTKLRHKSKRRAVARQLASHRKP